jgi:hypothetical protein
VGQCWSLCLNLGHADLKAHEYPGRLDDQNEMSLGKLDPFLRALRPRIAQSSP